MWVEVRVLPVYEYRCGSCGAEVDRILPHEQADAPGPCACGGTLRRLFSRVAVRYEGWGFRTNDTLVPERRGRRNDWRAVKERAEKLSDTGEL
jgi:putative FmdB family regulatory protein